MRRNKVNHVDVKRNKQQEQNPDLEHKEKNKQQNKNTIGFNMDKYKAINDNYFGFDIFEEIFKAINERASTNDDHMFKAGVASAEGAVRRLREDYYKSIKQMYVQEDTHTMD